jgi:WD40 repeat protein
MIPEHRLAHLLDGVKQSWIANCDYHTSGVAPSLYVDHKCDPDNFPTRPSIELRNHTDEVWYLKFSHDGSMLASASKDGSVVIYETDKYKPIFQLEEHDAGVGYIAWSPDDTTLVTCCGVVPECSAKIWDMKVDPPLHSLLVC